MLATKISRGFCYCVTRHHVQTHTHMHTHTHTAKQHSGSDPVTKQLRDTAHTASAVSTATRDCYISWLFWGGALGSAKKEENRLLCVQQTNAPQLHGSSATAANGNRTAKLRVAHSSKRTCDELSTCRSEAPTT